MTDMAPGGPGKQQRFLVYLAALVAISILVFRFIPKELEGEVHLLTINDTYHINGLYEGTEGGPARVRALRQELEEKYGGPVLLLHGGDVISPSFIGRIYEGRQMIEVFNLLDGRDGEFDPYMFAVLGNHEFDEDASVLDARLAESQFVWLGANVMFKSTADGTPLVGGANLKPAQLISVGGLKVGIFGLVLASPNIDFIERFAEPLETARYWIRELKKEGADVVIGLTHQSLGADEALLQALCGQGLDLIVGGHEHTNREALVTCKETGRQHFVLKADADAVSARHITISLKAGRVTVEQELRKLKDSAPAADPDVEALAQAWRHKHQKYYCEEKLKLPAPNEDCLDVTDVGATSLRLEAEEIKIRSYETNLGNWVADRMLASYPRQFRIEESARAACDRAPRVAFVNSGSLRLNQDLNRDGTAAFPIKLRHFEELLQYDNSLVLIKIDGKTLQEVANNAASNWEGNGRWLQVAGFGFKHDGNGNVSDLNLLDADGKPMAIELGTVSTICAITSEFLVNPNFGDQDGYSMLNLGQILNDLSVPEAVGAKWPRKLKAVIRAAFEATKAAPIERAHIKMGRTCRYDPADEQKTCKANQPE